MIRDRPLYYDVTAKRVIYCMAKDNKCSSKTLDIVKCFIYYTYANTYMNSMVVKYMQV